MSLQKPINVYVCQKCRQGVVTIDRDEGATPFLIRCVSSKGCDGMAQSELYSVPQDLNPSYEWRRPTKTEYYKLDKATRAEHVDRGGLLLYPLDCSKLERPPLRQPSIRSLKTAGRKRKSARKEAIRTAKTMLGGRLNAEEMATIR